jgi:DNA-binding beta-propeller fold protein YncE
MPALCVDEPTRVNSPSRRAAEAKTGTILNRIPFPQGARPHHVHASAGGNLIAVGLFGTDLVAVIDTHDDTLLGPWDSNPLTTNGRVHAAVFSQDAQTLYLANEGANEVIALEPRTGIVLWRMSVPAVHELAVTHDGKTAYVTRRTANRLAVIDLEARTYQDVLSLGLPDTLQLSANEDLVTVGLRTMPAQLAVVDTRTLSYALVALGPSGEATTIGGHQWTSPGGRYTFASFEGGTSPGVTVIDHRDGNRVVQMLSFPGRPHGVDHAQP